MAKLKPKLAMRLKRFSFGVEFSASFIFGVSWYLLIVRLLLAEGRSNFGEKRRSGWVDFDWQEIICKTD